MGMSGNDNTISGNRQSTSTSNSSSRQEIMVHKVKREEVESKIAAWETAEIAKINSRFKREDAIISSWENQQVHKASSWMKKVEVTFYILSFLWT